MAWLVPWQGTHPDYGGVIKCGGGALCVAGSAMRVLGFAKLGKEPKFLILVLSVLFPKNGTNSTYEECFKK